MTWTTRTALACTLAVAASAQSPDTDRDGLSDFAEIHKHLTDPGNPDSDGDGIPDGDWRERREFAYTVRAVLHVMAPFDVESMDDDYQDVRVLERTADLLEVEVVVYPFNTVAEALVPSAGWRRGRRSDSMRPYLAPGRCSNWDESMREALLTELSAAGVDLDVLDDSAAAVAVAGHLLERARYDDGFTTFAAVFEEDGVALSRHQEDAVRASLRRRGRTLEEQWERELFGRGMFAHRVHGSCTSTAIYLSTGLRAAGIPTRSVVCVPIVDANDVREVGWIEERIGHVGVRSVLRDAAREQNGTWTSHTFNEVFVGGRWRRLDGAHLARNVLDPGRLGLMVHVHTFRDHAEAGLSGWGDRLAHPQHAALFGGPNPYSCVSLSDRFGVHANVENTAFGPAELRITRVSWFDDPGRPVDTTLAPGWRTEHHLVVEFDRGEHSGQEALAFWRELKGGFLLRADGHADVSLREIAKFWGREGVFLLQIDPAAFRRMPIGVAYELTWSAPDGERRRWVVPARTAVVRRGD